MTTRNTRTGARANTGESSASCFAAVSRPQGRATWIARVRAGRSSATSSLRFWLLVKRQNTFSKKNRSSFPACLPRGNIIMLGRCSYRQNPSFKQIMNTKKSYYVVCTSAMMITAHLLLFVLTRAWSTSRSMNILGELHSFVTPLADTRCAYRNDGSCCEKIFKHKLILNFFYADGVCKK